VTIQKTQIVPKENMTVSKHEKFERFPLALAQIVLQAQHKPAKVSEGMQSTEQ
jgi:hypothetical protein